VSVSIDDISPAPWSRHDWTGELVSADGCPTDDFTKNDVARIVAWATTPGDWDGDTAGLIVLGDGRYVAWEAGWGPTGDGFSCDAYGGTADLVFAHTAEAAVARLTERGRELLATVTP
jgi:hypothetical protein